MHIIVVSTSEERRGAVRLNADHIVYYGPSSRHSSRTEIQTTNGPSLQVVESPEDIDAQLEDFGLKF